jgi:hypothetical protein
MAQTYPGRRGRQLKYDDYVNAVQRCGAWGGGIVGGLLAFAWGYTTIGLGAGIFFGACGAFVGTLIAAIASWLLVPHVLGIALCVLAAAALPFALIWLAGAVWNLR